MNMDRRASWKHWFADVGYIYVLVAVLVGGILLLTEIHKSRPDATSLPPASQAPGYSPPK
jgi:hypothetical protein